MAFAKDRAALAREVGMRFPLVLAFAGPAFSATVEVKSADDLRPAVSGLKSGDTLKIGPGDYPAGHYLSGIEKLTIEALDPEKPPHFKGGKEAWHFSRCPDLTLRNLRVSGQSANGINLDDGGELDKPVDGIFAVSIGVRKGTSVAITDLP